MAEDRAHCVRGLREGACPLGGTGSFKLVGRAVVNNLLANYTGDAGLIPASGTSSGGGNGNPLWYSCLENLMD